jgi:hypothetical protein
MANHVEYYKKGDYTRNSQREGTMSHDFLSTGQISELTGVKVTIIQRQFDRGLLKGFHVPGSNHRRVPVANVREWMVNLNIPTDKLDRLYPHLVPPKPLEIQPQTDVETPDSDDSEHQTA